MTPSLNIVTQPDSDRSSGAGSPGGPSSVLRVESLRKVYSTGTEDVEAIADISFGLDEGELVCIVGPSGCGKTTLLRCVAGLLPPTSGSVTLKDRPVTAPPPDLAVVFQEYGRSLFAWMTVRGNVELPLKAQRVGRAERRDRAQRALDSVGLGDRGDVYPWQLSGGMQQRVAIARALAYEPRVLLMDEPFAAVDAQTRAELEDLIRELWSALGMTVLFVTHDIDESVYLGERVLVLSNSPTYVQEDLRVDLPVERDQLTTRSLRRFTELRSHVYEQIQRAKRPAS